MKTTVKSFVHNGLVWVWRGVFGDIRSAVVGSVFGALMGIAVTYLSSGPSKSISIYTNDAGYGSPMNTLLEELEDEDKEVEIDFEPTSLKSMYVCEYAHVNGDSYRDIFFSYIDKYSACLWVSERSPEHFIIYPNGKSGIMVQREGDWFCKCDPGG